MNRNTYYLLRFIFTGIGVGLFTIFVLKDERFGIGWISAYTLCILFSWLEGYQSPKPKSSGGKR